MYGLSLIGPKKGNSWSVHKLAQTPLLSGKNKKNKLMISVTFEEIHQLRWNFTLLWCFWYELFDVFVPVLRRRLWVLFPLLILGLVIITWPESIGLIIQLFNTVNFKQLDRYPERKFNIVLMWRMIQVIIQSHVTTLPTRRCVILVIQSYVTMHTYAGSLFYFWCQTERKISRKYLNVTKKIWKQLSTLDFRTEQTK